jgi:hemerythrin superfamily protein
METSIEQDIPRQSGQSKRQDATTLLRADHKVVADLFREYRRTKAKEDKRALISRICRELNVHAQVEEEIFYPAVKEALHDDQYIPEAQVEHASLKNLIAQVEDGEPGDETFEAKVKVLSEYVKHHVNEEQTEIFPRARSSDLDMKELGSRLMERKAQLMAQQFS